MEDSGSATPMIKAHQKRLSAVVEATAGAFGLCLLRPEVLRRSPNFSGSDCLRA